MLTSLILTLGTLGTLGGVAPGLAALGAAEASTTSGPITAPDDFADRYATAKNDPGALWDLYKWCLDQPGEGGDARSERVLRRIIRLEPENLRARQALGHVRENGQWFASEGALERHRRATSEEGALARGLVKFRREFVHPDAIPRLRKGAKFDRVRGLWIDRRGQRRLKLGWELQDETWVRPDDVGKIDEGLWLVADEWVDAERADSLRSKIGRSWVIPGSWIRLHTTARRALAQRATREMEEAVVDLQRVFGVEPLWPLDVALWRTEEQYDRHAAGDPAGRLAPTHVPGLHVVYSGFFAESWFGRDDDGDPIFHGMGVSYWNEDVENGDLFGVHNARLATGLSYVDAIDPSPAAVTAALEAEDEDGIQRPAGFARQFRSEKQLPLWLHWGAAVYAERFFADPGVADGKDLWWPRTWSLDNLRTLGGLEDIKTVFAMGLDAAKPDESRRLLIEAGLLVAYMVDGRSTPVEAAHVELKSALASRDSARIRAAVRGVEAALLADRPGIEAFANRR